MKNKIYLIDLDGTMYKGKAIIPAAKRWIDHLIENDIPFKFLTNNSSRTPSQCAKHMMNIGFEKIKPEYFYTSAMAAADYIAKNYPNKKRACMIGQEGLSEALLNRGFEIVEENADFAFIGLSLNAGYQEYSKILQQCLQGAVLVGTNNDRILLNEKGAGCGNGSIVALFEYALNKPSLKIGKPYPPIIEGVLQELHATKEEVIMVGDNLETDILCGINSGIETILVLGGVHDEKDIESYDIHPTHIIKSLDELIK